LLLFPKGPLQAALRTDPGLFSAVFQALRKIDTDAFIRETAAGCIKWSRRNWDAWLLSQLWKRWADGNR